VSLSGTNTRMNLCIIVRTWESYLHM